MRFSAGILKSLAALALPMLVTAALQSATGLIKLYWVGRFGRDALASVATSETIALLLLPLLIGLSTGTSAIVARAAGRGDGNAAGLTAIQSVLLAVVLGSMSAFIGRFFSRSLLAILGADPAVVRAGHGYLDVLLLGVMPLFVVFIVSAALNATGHAVESMVASGIVSVVTIVSTPCLMFGIALFPSLGLAGAAWASVLADLTGAAVCLWMLFRHRDSFTFHLSHWWPDPEVMRRVMRIGAAGFGQLLLRIAAGATMMRVVASGGTSAIVAYGIGLRLDAAVLTPSFALGGAAATLVGISLGARDPIRAREAAWSAAMANLALILPIIVLAVVFAPPLAGRFTRDMPAIAMAAAYLRIIWPTHLFTAASITFGRAMQGAGDTISSMFITIAGLWVLQIPMALLLAALPRPAYQGFWWAIAIGAVAQGIMMTAWFETGRWKTKAV